MARRVLAAAFAGLLAPLAATGPARAQSWNLYDSNVSLPTISFAGGAMSPTNAATVYLTMSGGTGSTLTRAFTMDTGSTGIIATADNFTPGPNDVLIGPGTQYYSSSGRQENGYFYETNVVINKDASTPLATAKVTVLLVTNITCKFTDKGCVANPNPSGVAYMGVGFNRGDSAIAPPAPYNNTNPFTNIVSLAQAAIDAGASIGTLRQGYRITNTGVTLGLSSGLTNGYAFVKLQPDTSGAQPAPAWLGAPMTITVGGVTGSGNILPDSGINYAFLTPPSGASIPTQACPNPPGGNGCIVPSSGTQVQVYLPGQLPTQPAFYSFTTGTTGNPTSPEFVQVIADGPSIFLNTGREFYAGFDYVYDAVGGFVGYHWTSPAGATGSSTSTLALTGPVNLQSGFSTDYPTYLMAATSLLQTGTGTMSGVISGPGGLTIGSGQVNLTGVNTYTGGTTVSGGGILGINANSGAGAVSGGLTLNNGTLLALASITSGRTVTLGAGGGTFNTNGNDITLTTAVQGSGGLTKSGAGILTLAGANSYAGGTTLNAGALRLATGASLPSLGALTVNGGTFDLNGNDVTVGALSGSGGTISLGSGNLISNDSAFTTLATTITGTGGLTKTGSGTLILSGASTYTGPTSITGGRLSVNGSITSNVTVGSNGNLGGAGTITGTVVNGGVLAPGNSIGTLSVVGSYTQNAGSTYQVETNGAGQADRINISGAPGTATINGGTVSVTGATGIYAPSTTYTILNATGGVTGTFAAANSLFPFLQPSLGYDANNVYLTLRPGGFQAGAATANQAAVGGVLDRSVAGSSGDFANVIGTLATFGLTQGQAAMDQLSGQNYSGFGTANIGSGLMFMNVLGQQMSLARGGSGSGTRVAVAEACDVGSNGTCDGGEAGPWSLWGSALGATGSIAGNGNAATLTYNAAGFATGIDYRPSPHLLAGLGVGFASGNQWLGGFSGRGTSNSIQTSAYASFTQGAFYVDALAGYIYNDNQMTRQILIPGLQPRTATGQTGANQIVGQAEAGYRVDIRGRAAASLTPFARLQTMSIDQGAFSEAGASSLNLNVAQQVTGSVRTMLGAEMAGAFDVGWRERLALQMRLGWAHEYADVARPVTASFAGAPGAAFTVYGAAAQRDAAVIGLAADTAIAQATSLYLRYDGELAAGSDSHSLSAGVRMTW